VPHIPDFLWSFVGSRNFMRLSLKRAAHAVLSRAAYRKFGASRSFFARCGIPQVFPSSLSRAITTLSLVISTGVSMDLGHPLKVRRPRVDFRQSEAQWRDLRLLFP
jgi:hypothetical protein